MAVDIDSTSSEQFDAEADRRQVFSAKVPRIVHMHAGRHSKMNEKKSPTKSPQINVSFFQPEQNKLSELNESFVRMVQGR